MISNTMHQVFQNNQEKHSVTSPVKRPWLNSSPHKKESLWKEPFRILTQETNTTLKSCTPVKDHFDKNSHVSKTPFSVVDKIFDTSPFKTSCQKKRDSPFIDSNNFSELKKVKKEFISGFSSIFCLSNEKENKSNCLNLYPSFDISKTEEPYQEMELYDSHFLHFFTDTVSNEVNIQGQTNKILFGGNSQGKQFGCSGCNCRNTKCIKMYCECFRKGVFCVGCNCVGCENVENSELRERKVAMIQKKNPEAGQIQSGSALRLTKPSVGSFGRKRHSAVNECECHQFGAKCSELCQCVDCHNIVDKKFTNNN